MLLMMKDTRLKEISVFFVIPKNPGIFHKPKKIPYGQNFRPHPPSPIIKICEWGPWGLYVFVSILL